MLFSKLEKLAKVHNGLPQFGGAMIVESLLLYNTFAKNFTKTLKTKLITE